MTGPLVIVALGILASAVNPPASFGAELARDTVSAWDQYVKSTEERIAAELNDRRGFLALDFAPHAAAVRRSVLNGELVITRAETRGRHGGRDIPGGSIHHWRAAVLVRGITVDRLMAALRDPERHGYRPPDVLRRRLLERSGARERVFLQIQRREIVTAVFNTEHEVHFTAHPGGRGSSRSISTRIAEVEHAGTPSARERPVGNDRGFLWRLNSYWRYEPVPGGVIVELESLSLSRSVPFVLAPIAGPIITRVARESIERTLGGIRNQLGNAERGTRNPEPGTWNLEPGTWNLEPEKGDDPSGADYALLGGCARSWTPCEGSRSAPR
jgi:hypothetical protein